MMLLMGFRHGDDRVYCLSRVSGIRWRDKPVIPDWKRR
jgi:hypothetical protein